VFPDWVDAAGLMLLFMVDLEERNDGILVFLVGIKLGVGLFRKKVADVFELFSPYAPDAIVGFVAAVPRRNNIFPPAGDSAGG
jgi:hypothetical protein